MKKLEKMIIPFNQIPLMHAKLSGSLELCSGQIVGLMGPNGSGKSSLLQYIRVNSAKIMTQRCSFMDQGRLIALPSLKVEDLFKMLSEEFSERTQDFSEKSEYFFSRYLFHSKLKNYIESLSGGENQVLKMLVCFLLDTEIYFFDEPTNHLDQNNLKLLMEDLNQLKNDGKYLLVASHNKDFLKEICEKIYVLEHDSAEGTISIDTRRES